MSQFQSQSTQLQPQLNSLQRDMQQRLQTSGALLQTQNVIDQQKQLFQSQRALPEASSTSLDSTAQTGTTNVGDWQEEVYQKHLTICNPKCTTKGNNSLSHWHLISLKRANSCWPKIFKLTLHLEYQVLLACHPHYLLLLV